MTDDVSSKLKEAIRHRIACIDRPTLNGFAGTGRSRRRENQSTHTIARRIVDEGLRPFLFHWNQGNREPATRNDVYLTVVTTLLDIDDEDARRWTDRSEWDIARFEATRDMVAALTSKFVVTKRRTVIIVPENYSFGSHNISESRYEDEL